VYEGYGPSQVIVCDDIRYLPLDETSYVENFTSLVTAAEIMIFCTLCLAKKFFFRFKSYSTFMEQLRDFHQLKLNLSMVAQCPMCAQEFNSVHAAKTHLRRRHKKNLTQKILKELTKYLTDHSDPENAIDWTEKIWTTKLREVECFASLSYKVHDCFTCPHSLTQNKNKIASDPPPRQFAEYPVDKMIQVTQPNTCPVQHTSIYEFTHGIREITGNPSRFKSAFDTPEGNEWWRVKHSCT